MPSDVDTGTGHEGVGGGPALHGTVVPVSGVDADLLARWRDLARRSQPTNPFFEPDVVLAAARHLEDGDRVLLVCVRAGERLVFLLPVLDRVRYRRRLPVRTVTMWAHLYCSLGTPLLDPAHGGAGWTAALDAMRAARLSAWLVVELCDESSAEQACTAARRSGRAARITARESRAVVRRGPIEDYLAAHVSAQRRKKMRQVRQRITTTLGVEPVVVDRMAGAPPVDRAAALEEFLQLEASGWKGREGGAFAARPHHAAFFREASAGLAAGGRLQLLSLQSAGRTLAMDCNIVSDDGLFDFKIAYDEELARFSPGILLMAEQLRTFAGSGLAFMDSCADPDNETMNAMYQDRRPLATLFVQVRGRRGALAVRYAGTGKHVRERVAAVRYDASAAFRRLRRWGTTNG